MPTPTKVQLTGGIFQDAEGNALANGYLEMQLSQDGAISGVGQIVSGVTIKIQLNSSGSVVTSPVQSVWGNDQISPINSFYRVTGFTAAGQPAWGPNNQQVNGSGGTFDVGTWIPNRLISWIPPLQPVELETNGVANGNQSLLNLKNGSNVTITDDGFGGITIAAASGATVELQTNGVDNTSQTKLNLKNGTNVTITSDGVGGVTINSSATPIDLQTNSVDNPSQTKLNLEDTATVAWTASAGGVVKADVVGSGGSNVDLTAQSASIGTTPIISSASAGLYRISFYFVISQAATTSSSIKLTLNWTDSFGAQTYTTPAIVINTGGYFISDVIAIESAATQAITYSTTYASVGGTSMQYNLRVHVTPA